MEIKKGRSTKAILLLLTTSIAVTIAQLIWMTPKASVEQQNGGPLLLPGLPLQSSKATPGGVKPPVVYFVLTASLNKAPSRCSQYARGLESLRNETVNLNKEHKIIFVEGNGQRTTCLDDLGVEVLYTDNNNATVPHNNYGIKELMDVMASVEHLGMKDSDLLVKMTGRYLLSPGSLFMETLNQIDLKQTCGIVKFGPYFKPSDKRMADCITGLLMLPVSTIPVIWNLTSAEPRKSVEVHWGAAALLLPEDQVVAVQGKMGIYITPGMEKRYFLV